nr:hypothetical protein [uncultured Helicobacter sp.]
MEQMTSLATRKQGHTRQTKHYTRTHKWLDSGILGGWFAWFIGVIALGGMLGGCATDVAKLEHFSKIYYQDSVPKAHKLAQKHAKDNDLLWLIQAGVSGFQSQSPAALELLDKSEEQLLAFEKDGILVSALVQTGATLVNDNVLEYRGNLYEGVFVNYYKALLYLSSGDTESARVELNRANDRQRRAKDYYAKQIAKAMAQEQARFEKSEANGLVDTDSKQVDKILHQHYSNLAAFSAFEHFINPSVSYLSGLIFALQGDSKGLDYLKEAYGISQSKLIAQDLEYFLRQRAARAKSSKHTNAFTWIILEEGRQVRKTEARIDLPLLTTQGFYHFGIALPQLESTPQPSSTYTLGSSVRESSFELLAYIDGIIATEFEKQLQAIATRALVSGSIKLAMQIALHQGLEQVDPGLGLLGALAGHLYSRASTSADLRITSVLPRQILLVRIKHENAQQEVQILRGSQAITTLHIQPCTPNPTESKAQAPKSQHAKSHNTIALCLGQDSILYIRDTPARAYTRLIFQAP